MRPPAPSVLVLVAPLLACFADAGGRSSVGSVTASESSSGEASTTGSATTGAPTSDATTGDATTGDATTTATPTTGALDSCEGAPECEAGTVEDGPLCEPCGVQRRTCQADCTWSPMTCVQAPDTCEYWVLESDKKQWQRVARDPAAAFAPDTTVLAAVALPPQQQIYVLTEGTYHVFSTDKRAWTAAGERKAVFPQLDGLPVFHATGLTTMAPDTIVTIVAGKDAYSYTFTKNSFEFGGQQPCCGENWSGPNAPDPFSVRDGWSRLDDPEGWIVGDVQELCGLMEPTPVYGYHVSIGDGAVYPQDIGHCFDFFPPVTYPRFTPFGYPGAPPSDLVGGAEWLDGLWIFRGE